MRYVMLLVVAIGCQPTETPKLADEHIDVHPVPVKLVAIDRADQANRLAKFMDAAGKDWLIFFDTEPKPKQFGRFLTTNLFTVQVLDKRSVLAEFSYPAKKVSGAWDGSSAGIELKKCFVIITDIDTSKATAGTPVPNAAITTAFEVVGYHEQKMKDGTTRKLPQLQPVHSGIVNAASK